MVAADSCCCYRRTTVAGNRMMAGCHIGYHMAIARTMVASMELAMVGTGYHTMAGCHIGYHMAIARTMVASMELAMVSIGYHMMELASRTARTIVVVRCKLELVETGTTVGYHTMAVGYHTTVGYHMMAVGCSCSRTTMVAGMLVVVECMMECMELAASMFVVLAAGSMG
jgi:hypothetical protein